MDKLEYIKYKEFIAIIKYLIVPPDIIIGSGYLSWYIYHQLKDRGLKVLWLRPCFQPLTFTTSIPTENDIDILSSFLKVEREMVISAFNKLFIAREKIENFECTVEYVPLDPKELHSKDGISLHSKEGIQANILKIDKGDACNHIHCSESKTYHARHIILAEEWDPIAITTFLNKESIYYQGCEYRREGFKVHLNSIEQDVCIQYNNCFGEYTIPQTSDPKRDALIVAYLYFNEL